MKIKYACLLITLILLVIGLNAISASDLSDNPDLSNQTSTDINYDSTLIIAPGFPVTPRLHIDGGRKCV